MRGRTLQSTNPPVTRTSAPPAEALPEPTGPTDDRFVYTLTEAGLRALIAAQAQSGDQAVLFEPVARASLVAEALPHEARQVARARLAREARRRDRRLGTVSRCSAGGQPRPMLRLTGAWLTRAGFGVGQRFTVEPTAGRLVLETWTGRRGRPAPGRPRTVSHRSAGGARRPLLRLSGQWLAAHGFAIGQHFEVDVAEGRLVLEAVGS